MNKALNTSDKINYQEMKEFLLNSFFSHICKDKPIKLADLNKIHKCSIAIKAFDLVSISMSYLAVNNYRQGARYFQTLTLLNDAKYLASSSNSAIAQKINLFCFALIEYLEKNIEPALNLLNASLYIKTDNIKF